MTRDQACAGRILNRVSADGRMRGDKREQCKDGAESSPSHPILSERNLGYFITARGLAASEGDGTEVFATRRRKTWR